MAFLSTSAAERDGWLFGMEKQNMDTHPDFPEPYYDGMVIRPYSWCSGCPQVNKDGHKSYGCAVIKEALPAVNRITISHLRRICNLIERLSHDAREPAYYNPDFLPAPLVTRWTLSVISVQDNKVIVSGIDTDNVWTCGPADGSPMSGDRVEPDSRSAMYQRSRPAVRSVERVAEELNQARLVCDRPVEDLIVPGEPWDPDESAPENYTVTLCRESERPKYPGTNIPTVLWTRPRIVTVSAANFPEDKCFALDRSNGDPGAIPWPDVYADALTVETLFEGVWTDISTDCRNNVRVNMEKADTVTEENRGYLGLGITKTWLCLGTTNKAGATGLTDLLATAEKVRITYRAETKHGKGCPSYARCKHSFHLTCGSDYGVGVVEGVAQDELDRMWICKQADASGRANYQPNCALYGTCDGFAPIDTADRHEAAWDYAKDISPFLRSITHQADVVATQAAAGSDDYAYTRTHQSLYGLHGGVSLTSAGGYHPTVVVQNWGMGYVGNMETATTDGNVELNALWGAVYDGRQDWSALAWDDNLAHGTLSTQWEAKNDFRGIAITGTTDPWFWFSRHFYKQSPRINRDGGTITEKRGAAWWQQVRDCHLLSPAIELTTYDEVQDRQDSYAVIYSAGETETVSGIEMGGYIQFERKAQSEKAVQVIGTATVVDVEVFGSQVHLYFENVVQSWTYVSAPMTEATVTFAAGGGVVQPPDNLKVNSHAHEWPSFGAPQDRISGGDSIRFHELVNADRMEDQFFVVNYVKAFADEDHKATDFTPGTDPGDITYTPGFSTEGKGLQYDKAVIQDEAGRLAALGATLIGEEIEITRGSAVLFPTDAMEVKATVFQTDAYATMTQGTDIVLWQGNGRIWLSKTWCDAKRALTHDVWCFYSPKEEE